MDKNKLFSEEKQELFEEIKKHKLEKETLIKEYEKDLEGIKEKTKKKNDVFNDFLHKMNFRIDNSQKYFNENIDNEKDDTKLMEVLINTQYRSLIKTFRYILRI